MNNTPEKRLYNILKRKPNSNTVKKLLKEGVDCNLSHFDRDILSFICPIDLAISKDRHRSLCLLYEHRSTPTKIQLEKHVSFYISHHVRSSEEENEILFDYTVSRLLYVRINDHRKIVFHTLIEALHDHDNGTLRGESLCQGSTHEILLQLRIYTLFKKIIDMNINCEHEFLSIIEDELLHNLETYYFLNSIYSIPVVITKQMINKKFTEIMSHSLLLKYYQCIGINLINKIQYLPIDKEYTIPTGWMKHAVCISFRRINESHISIRVDNPSPFNPQRAHRTVHRMVGPNQIYPRVLGQLHVNHLKDNSNYFILLIDSVKRDLTRREGISLIYNLEGQIRHLDRRNIEQVPSFIEQAEANCFVKCYEPGFWIRFGRINSRLYEQLLLCEKDNANRLEKHCEDVLLSEENYPNLGEDHDEAYLRHIDNLYSRFTLLSHEDNIINLPLPEKIRLQNQLKTSYKQHYQYLMNNRSSLVEKYIPLQFNDNKTLIELNDIFIKPRVMLIGDAGCGKTTICQYVTYTWAHGEIWEDRYEWLFYIKMRNLNSEFYPSRLNNYSLIDIIEQECFQGYKLTDLDKLKLEKQFENSSNILWILDGCDECVISNYLHKIQRELFAKPHLLLTSRPYIIDNLIYDIQIKIQNFQLKDIQNYIEKYFPIMFKNMINECWTFIRTSEHLQKIASIPACLQIICQIWERKKDLFDKDMSIGELYEKLSENILRKYLLKFHGQCTSALAGKDIYQQSNSIAFTYLEYIAFKMTKSQQLIINGNELANITNSSFISTIQIGLLILETENPSHILANNKYYFIHRSFQEYLCARYMIRSLSLIYSEEQKQEVILFINHQKYNRNLENIFRLFFDLKQSISSIIDLFWLAIDTKPRDLVGLRHCSRINRWFYNGRSEYHINDKQKINQRTIDFVLNWISNKQRRAHDFSNKYLFEWFFGLIDHQIWLKAWKEDLLENDPLKRRYFLPDLWSTNNIDALKRNYNNISENKVEQLHFLITKGPIKRIIDQLDLNSNLFILYKVNDEIQTSKSVIITAQNKANKHQSITDLEEFEAILQNYSSFAKLNRRQEALDIEIWPLKIDSSALKNMKNKTLKLLLELSKENILFYRDIQLPVIPFLELYANQNDLDDNILCPLIVSITFSSKCIITELSDNNNNNNIIRIYNKDETFVDIQFNQQQFNSLIHTFHKNRDYYGFSSVYLT